MKDTLKSRGQALEDSLFHNVDQALIELMQEQNIGDQARRKLSESTGISNEAILDELLDVGVNHSTIISFLLLPLAVVAWADGRVDEEEKTAVMNTAFAIGYGQNSAAVELLQKWLSCEPDSRLFKIWREYAGELCSHLKRRDARANGCVDHRTSRNGCQGNGWVPRHPQGRGCRTKDH